MSYFSSLSRKLRDILLLIRPKRQNIILEICMPSCKTSVILFDFNSNLNIITNCTNHLPIWNFTNIRPVGVKFFQVAFHVCFAKVPKPALKLHYFHLYQCVFSYKLIIFWSNLICAV
jgi:hypothetical protein